MGSDGGWNMAAVLAGWWLGLVSLPVFQFLWLRWYFRLFIWARSCGRCHASSCG